MVFTVEEKGFIIEADGKKLWVSYNEFSGSHHYAMEFCKEQGGGDETVENLQLIARYIDAINEELRKLGKKLISSWYWSNKTAWWDDRGAFIIPTNYYRECLGNRSSIYLARAVKEL